MTENDPNSENLSDDGNVSDEMAEYLQTFLDETEEQLDSLVETMLSLERDSTNVDDLNEAFRLIHSIKGSAGMMGLDSIAVLTHHLENRFERFRSGLAQLDEPTMNLVLRCIDFLRNCNDRLRGGGQLGSPAELLAELRQLEEHALAAESVNPQQSTELQQGQQLAAAQPQPTAQDDEQDGLTRMVVRFRAGLQLADLKAQLIVSRIAGLVDVKSTSPELDRLSDTEEFEQFEVRFETHEDLDRLREAADVDGVESIEFTGASSGSIIDGAVDDAADQDEVAAEPPIPDGDPATPPSEPATFHDDVVTTGQSRTTRSMTTSANQHDVGNAVDETRTQVATKAEVTTAEPASRTMRVDIDRLDNLMNLVGELVVNRARFVQIFGQISPELRKSSMLSRIRDFSDGLRHTIEGMEHLDADWSAQIQQMRAGLELMDEQSAIWENGRQSVSQMSEAIDQLSQVSNSLQRGVLGTRMVPVGPLFNRFKRVVRDLSKDRGKHVNLLIRGEKTELDKRMIDELGDPLVHLVRNSIDHGLEPPDVRVSRNKSETGTIFLEASHNGNNVHIHVRDDGRGIDVDKIKAKLIENHILAESAAHELSDEQALDYIWHPGFSTAKEVTDVSGRGVGMDAVKTRIQRLNGTIEIDSTPQQGTTFTIRLPLTLAIINSLLVRLRNVTFSMPIDDVREIVSVVASEIVTVHQRQVFDVRGEMILLVSMDDVFQCHDIDYGYHKAENSRLAKSTDESVDVVILHSAGKTIGLRVDELLGSQEVVIKSLADNFINIRGLSGASVLGDGSVCLMLDVGTVIDMAT